VTGFDLFLPPSSASAVSQALAAAGAVPADQQTYEVLRVEAGWPVLGKDMDEERLVMEAGRTRQAISYTKGCFLGQEPIVMARDRGHVNRTLLGLRIAADVLVASGAKVLHEGKDVGQVTSSVRSPRLGVIALAYLQRGSQTPGTEVEIDTPDGRRAAVIASLPFSPTDPAPA
jgi:folate-binding protein YgfZ